MAWINMRCRKCGRDLNDIWQDNMSETLSYALCEDCSGVNETHQYYDDFQLQLEVTKWNKLGYWTCMAYAQNKSMKK